VDTSGVLPSFPEEAAPEVFLPTDRYGDILLSLFSKLLQFLDFFVDEICFSF
jgi:hypothetical protein